MCFESDSLPPIPAISGAAVSHDDLVLEAADGNRFAAFAATPDEPSGAGIVILPEIRGLYRFYEELALRFAERGHAAIAIDYFGRTAGAEKRGDDFEWGPHVEQTTGEGIQSDVAAAVARLRADGATAVFTVGFCFGGRHSWFAAAGRHGLAGAIGFYGRPGTGRDGSAGPTTRAGELQAPILALMGRAVRDRGHGQLVAADQGRGRRPARRLLQHGVRDPRAPPDLLRRPRRPGRRPPEGGGAARRPACRRRPPLHRRLLPPGRRQVRPPDRGLPAGRPRGGRARPRGRVGHRRPRGRGDRGRRLAG